MKLVIDIPDEYYEEIENMPHFKRNYEQDLILDGTPLPKGHGFIAICDSDFPITEEVKQKLKNTIFVGNEDCKYCFDMMEIIEVKSEEELWQVMKSRQK